MKIDLYARCWNERDMLPFFFLHYDKLVQRYIIYEDGSTDNPQEILRLNPKVELRRVPWSDPDSRINSALAIWETCWRESRGLADWVIVTDVDEHLYHPDIYHYLAQCRAQGVTIIPALGYQMLSEQFPEDKTLLCQSLTRGACDALYSKLSIFSPNEIDTVNYRPGRHSAAPTGRVVLPARDELLLLHYRYLDFERVRKRYAQVLSTRTGKTDIAMGWGVQYLWSSEQLREAWDLMTSRLVDISQPDLRPWETHEGPRWWRSPNLALWECNEWQPWWTLPVIRRRRSTNNIKINECSIILKRLTRWLLGI
jgi:Glycosyl transferase family 2